MFVYFYIKKNPHHVRSLLGKVGNLKKNNKINKNDADFGHFDKRRKIFYEPALM